MNSSISNSDKHRRYVKGLFVIVFFPAFALFLLGIYLEPLYGDLTRIGLYDEKTFGWKQQQLAFSKPLYKQDQYNRYYDVVVIGDSFSRGWPQQQWQNHIAIATDWTIVTLNLETFNVDKLIDSQVFHDTPPKVFILESVERYFPNRIRSWQSCNEDINTSQVSLPLKRLSLPVKHQDAYLADFEKSTNYFDRPTAWGDIKLGFVLKFLWNGMLRAYGQAATTDARKIALIREAPFSSINKQELLVYKDDFQTVPSWLKMDLSDMGCRIENIRRKVEANGKTKFVLMIAPDKLTAYADFTAEQKLHDYELLAMLSEQHVDVIPRTDTALKEAIREEEMDVYLPDDTHWGSTGHRIVAETVLDFLRNH